MGQRFVNKDQALQKIRHYCAYQERCHAEVREKLYGFGLYKTDVETILAQLIEEDYLNEERFAEQFTGGKFRIKQWGRIRIQYALKQKKVSDYSIRKAMKSIDEEDYIRTLEKLAKLKWNSLKGEQAISKQAKTTQYLMQKGFELPLIQQAIKTCNNKNLD
jgi:regulatory protein